MPVFLNGNEVFSLFSSVLGQNAVEEIVKQIEDLGYSSFEEFYGLYKAAPGELSSYLKISQDTIRNIFEAASSVPELESAMKLLDSTEVPDRPLGLELLDSTEVPDRPLGLGLEDSTEKKHPPKMNLIPTLPDIRSQGRRETCVAFATMTFFEQVIGAGKATHYSEQFLYWACKQLDNDGSPGTHLRFAIQALEEMGCCLDTTWPYIKDSSNVGGDDQGPPTAAAVTEAKQHLMSNPGLIGRNVRDSDMVSSIKGNVARGYVVCFAIPVFNSWYSEENKAVHLFGTIGMPFPSEKPVGGHAMCIVGYEDSAKQFIIRNSWGASWAEKSKYGAGYGTIPYDYIANYLAEVNLLGIAA